MRTSMGPTLYGTASHIFVFWSDDSFRLQMVPNHCCREYVWMAVKRKWNSKLTCQSASNSLACPTWSRRHIRYEALSSLKIRSVDRTLVWLPRVQLVAFLTSCRWYCIAICNYRPICYCSHEHDSPLWIHHESFIAIMRFDKLIGPHIDI